MNYGWSNYFYFYFYFYFCFYVFYGESSITLGKKGEKDFGCEDYLKIERKKPFYKISERLTTIRPTMFFEKLLNARKTI